MCVWIWINVSHYVAMRQVATCPGCQPVFILWQLGETPWGYGWMDGRMGPYLAKCGRQNGTGLDDRSGPSWLQRYEKRSESGWPAGQVLLFTGQRKMANATWRWEWTAVLHSTHWSQTAALAHWTHTVWRAGRCSAPADLGTAVPRCQREVQHFPVLV